MALAVRLLAVLALSCALAAPVLGQEGPGVAPGIEPHGAPNASSDPDEDNPTPAPLPVGSMAIASDAALAVEAMAVNVAVDRVTYTYRLRDKGPTKLALAASVAMPDLEVNTEGTTVTVLPSLDAENPVGLAVTSAGTPVATTAYTQALALGIDRLAELKAARLPLIPFGEDTEKAIGALKPAALNGLATLGLVTPRDPAEPDTPAVAAWTLRTVHGWTQPLDPRATTEVKVSFTPIKAVYTIAGAGLPGFEALKSQVCLTPRIMAAAKALLTMKTATLEVVDITLANDGPARWLDNPPASIAVSKPKPDSVVAFCGMAAATAGQPLVKGTMPGSADAPGLRILVFSHGSTP